MLLVLQMINYKLQGFATNHHDHHVFPFVVNNPTNNNLVVVIVAYTNKTKNTHHVAFITCDATKLADATTWKQVLNIKTPYQTKSFSMHPSQQLLSVLGNDNNIYIYSTAENITNTTLLYTLKSLNHKNINSIVHHPDAAALVICCDGGQAGIVALSELAKVVSGEIAQPTTLMLESQSGGNLHYAAASEIGYQFATVSPNHSYAIYDLRKGGSCLYSKLSDNVQRIFFDLTGTYYFVVTTTDIQIYSLKDHSVPKAIINMPEGIKIHNAILQHHHDAIVAVGNNHIVYIEPAL
eukprot:UN04365